MGDTTVSSLFFIGHPRIGGNNS